MTNPNMFQPNPDMKDYMPTCDIKWKKDFWKGYILMQRWQCRFVEKSLPDIWIPVPYEDGYMDSVPHEE